MDDFEKELKVGFLEEASQLLSDTEQCFLVLESDPTNADTINKIFRLAHSVKGSAKAVGFDDLGAFTHQFESLLLKIKNGELFVTTQIVSLLLRCNDHTSLMIESLKADMDAKVDSTELMNELGAHIRGEFAQSAAPTAEEVSAVDELTALQEAGAAFDEQATVETLPSADAFGSTEVPVTHEAETLVAETVERADPTPELPAPHAELPAHAAELESAPVLLPFAPPPVAATNPPRASAVAHPAAAVASKAPTTSAVPEESIRVSLSRLETLLNFVGETVILQTVMNEQIAKSDNPLLKKTCHQLGKVTKEVQDISMRMRMVPVKQTFQKMQRIVRDTATILNRKVNLVLVGEETELDKTVLEKLGDPLVHMIRNAVDHGIEDPDKRLACGKPETGTIKLSAYHESGKLVIEIRDDGGGINGPRLLKKAIEKGIIKPGTQMSEQEAVNLIFAAGFSTKEKVTEVSGRGVGMDVVKTNIESIKGQVYVETVLGQGSLFKVILPLTLAIIDGMVVRVDNDRYIIPLSHVHESYRPTGTDIQNNAGLGATLLLRGENLPIFSLSTLLGKKTKSKDPTQGIAIVVRTQAKPFSILVDDIVGSQQVVIKKLGQEVAGLKGFGGSAILGDGKPSLILELNELVSPNIRRQAA